MKKLITGVLAITLILSLTACGGNEEEETVAEAEAAMTEAVEEVEEAAEDSAVIEVEENLTNVEIRLPAYMFEDMTEDEIKSTAKEEGVENVTVEADGTVVYKISKSEQKELLEQTKLHLDEATNEMMASGDIVSFKEVDYNDDLSEFTITADADAFNNSMDGFLLMTYYFYGSYYQMLSGTSADDVNVVVNVIDAATGDVIQSATADDFANVGLDY